MAQQWNPSQSNVNTLLSNNNLTSAGKVGGGAFNVSYGLMGLLKGLVYWEELVTIASAGDTTHGIGNKDSIVTDLGYPSQYETVGWFDTGVVYSEFVQIDTWASFTTGTRICFALNLNTGKIWGRAGVNGNWNNDVIANQDPANGIGGTTIPAGVLTTFIVPGVANWSSGDISTASFASSSWVGVPPVGFSAWDEQPADPIPAPRRRGPGAGPRPRVAPIPRDLNFYPPPPFNQRWKPLARHGPGKGPNPLIPLPFKGYVGLPVSAAPDVGSIVFTGLSPSVDESLLPGVGSIAFTGLAPSLDENVLPGVGSILFTGQAPSTDEAVLPGVGSVVLTGLAPSANESLLPGVGSVAFAGLAPSVNESLLPGVGSVVLAGLAPSTDEAVLPGVGSIVVTGLGPSTDEAVLPGIGSISFAGLAPSLDESLLPGVGSVVLTGLAPSADQSLLPGVGSIVVTGLGPSVAAGTVVAPGVGSISFAGLVPSVIGGGVVAPGAGSISFTGFVPVVTVPRVIVAQPQFLW